MAAAGGKLDLFASPWSPPAFMKDNGDMLHGGKLKRDNYQSWANYFAKFIKAYKRKEFQSGECRSRTSPWQPRNGNRAFLRPRTSAFSKASPRADFEKEGLADKKIIMWDHNRDLIYQRVSTMMDDPEAAKYVWGIGYHWYEPWSGGEMMFDNVKLVATPSQANPLYLPKAAQFFDPKKTSEWSYGERYGRSMIHDFNNGTVGWTDWNILLDETGGPNHVGNFCFAALHADTRTGELTYVNSFYYMVIFRNLYAPRRKRIASSPSRSSLLSTAFMNPGGKIAVVVMNKGDKKVAGRLFLMDETAKQLRSQFRRGRTHTYYFLEIADFRFKYYSYRGN